MNNKMPIAMGDSFDEIQKRVSETLSKIMDNDKR